MTQKNLLKIAFFFSLAIISNYSFGQTTIYSQSFETDLDGYSHSPSQTPSSDPGDQYFHRAEPSDSNIYEGSVGPYTNVTGSWLFVGSNPEDFNGGTSGILTVGNGIDVSGYSNLELSIDFGAVPSDWDAADNLSVEYSWDNSIWNTLYTFNSGAGNSPLDLTGNTTGGNNTSNGTTLTYALQTITSTNFIGSGNTIHLRVVCESEANYEAFGLDNIILTGTAASANPTVSFDAASSSETETDATLATSGIPITLTNYDADVTITATVNGTSTAEAGDYSISTFVLVFDANETLTIPLSINDDADFDDETIVIDFTVTSGTADLGTSTHTVTITDDDTPPSIGFDTTTSSETETDATFTSANIPITVSDYSGEQIDIDVTITGGTAEVNDYIYTTQSLSFTANETQNITLEIKDDADSDNETIVLTITETSSVTGLTISETTHTLTIADNEAPIANTLVTTIDFETENDGYTPSTTSGSGNTDTFNRVNTGINGNSTFYWVAEDISGNPSIDLSQIDVTNAASFTFSVDFSYDNSAQWDSTDELLITYSVDGGAYQNLMAVQHINSDGFNNPAALDLDFDGNGDSGQELSTSAFTTFTTSDILLSSNSILDIKFQFNNLTSNGEGIFIDNIVITETAASSDPTITFDAGSSSETETNATFATSGIPITLTNYDADVTVTATVNGSSTAEAGDYTIDLTPLVFDASETLNIPLSINPDADFEDETIVIDISVTSGTADITTSQHIVTISDDDLPAIFISEIMYDTRSLFGSDDEWIELYNGSGVDVDISNYTLEYNRESDGSGSETFTFPSSTTFTNGTYIILAVGSNGDGTFNNDNPFTPDFNNLSVTNATVASTDDSNNLTNSSRTIELKNTSNATIDIVTYSDADGADSNGSSFELIDSSADNSLTSSNWQESGVFGGSPKAIGSSYWTGALSTDWSVSGNWNALGIPSTSSNFVIPNGLTNYPIASSAVTINQGLIKSGATLDAESTFTGTVTYERSLGTTNWYLVSSPLSGETYNDDWVNASNIDDTSSTNGNIAIGTYTTSSDSWSYLQSGGSGTFANGAGYSVKQNFASNLYFSGSLNTENVPASVVTGGNGGFNLLGNPFTTNLSSAMFLEGNTGNLTSETLWVWNQALNTYETYVTGDSFILAPTQGFFVSASSSTDLNFAESYQTTTTGTFQKSVKTELKLLMTDGNNERYTRINYLQNATTTFDNGYDGETFGGIKNSLEVYTHLIKDNIGKKYQVQSLPNSDYENMVIPVGITADANKEITFTAEALNLPRGIKVYLEDRLTNTFTRLDELNNEYKITLSEKTDGIGRFYLHTKSSVLGTSTIDIESISIYKSNASTLRIAGLSNGKSTVKLFNILGKQVLKTSFTSNNGVQDINLPKLATGIYVVQLETEAGQLNKKITLD